MSQTDDVFDYEYITATSANTNTKEICNFEVARWKEGEGSVTAGVWDWELSQPLDDAEVDTIPFNSGSTKKCFKVCCVVSHRVVDLVLIHHPQVTHGDVQYVIKAFYNFGDTERSSNSRSSLNLASLTKEHSRALLLSYWLEQFYEVCGDNEVAYFPGELGSL